MASRELPVCWNQNGSVRRGQEIVVERGLLGESAVHFAADRMGS